MAGKGSGRRPGENYESNWDRIFGKKDKPTETKPWPDPAEMHMQLSWNDTPERRQKERRAEIDTDKE